MKLLFTGGLLFVLTGYSFSQTDSTLKATADSAVKAFTWDIEKADKGSLMYLDVAYQRDHSDSVEYLRLTVAKDTAQERPAFISIIIPNNIVQTDGIFIAFANTVTRNGQHAIEMEKSKPARVKFESCDNETCTARIVDGYSVNNDGTKQDIFQKFLAFDHVLFLFMYADGSHKSVAVPLFTFKEQYKNLEAERPGRR